MTRLVLEKGPRAVSSHQRPLTPAPSRARAAARRLPIWRANECGPLVGYPTTAHRQAELQVLLCHEQQISIQGARHRHCSGCRAPARPLRARPFSDPGAKFPLRQSRGPETEAGPHGPDSILGSGSRSGSGRDPDGVCVSGRWGMECRARSCPSQRPRCIELLP